MKKNDNPELEKSGEGTFQIRLGDLMDIVATLSMDDRQVILLYLSGHTVVEIALATHLNPQTVREKLSTITINASR